MSRARIKLVALGLLPSDLDTRKIGRWRSALFVPFGEMETFQLSEDAQGEEWEYTDDQLERLAPPVGDAGLVVMLTNVRLQHNWFVRRLSGNRLVFSFYEVRDILRSENVPLHNIVLRVIYVASLLYGRYHGQIPSTAEPTDYAHDETRGCLFDMCADKWDVIYSSSKPILCDYCVAELRRHRISNEKISSAQAELKGIRKPLFYRAADFVRRRPVVSLLISLLTAALMGTATSVLGNWIYILLSSA